MAKKSNKKLKKIKKITVIIPCYNEEKGIKHVIKDIPKKKLKKLGYKTEVLVIDNNCSDKTAQIAKRLGARVIKEGKIGKGNAYKAGFTNATGGIIATGDADLTYPFDILL